MVLVSELDLARLKVMVYKKNQKWDSVAVCGALLVSKYDMSLKQGCETWHDISSARHFAYLTYSNMANVKFAQ